MNNTSSIHIGSYHSSYTILIHIFNILLLAMLIAFFKTVALDPGVIRSTQHQREVIWNDISYSRSGCANIVAKSKGYDVSSMIIKPLRSKYCTKVNQSIYRFDHYCVWTGNAIGGGNHRFFLLFICLLFIYTLVHSYLVLNFLYSINCYI